MLLFWKLGTMIIKQVKSHAFLSYGIKDVVRSIFGKVCKLIIKFEFLTVKPFYYNFTVYRDDID